MPYTPPTNRSPASSAASSPDVSRRASLQSASRPLLPRSASYLNKHRRSCSINDIDAVSSAISAANAFNAPISLDTSVRQSPPPPPDESAVMPRGAIVSPPESTCSASDEEEDTPEIRKKKSDVLKDLRVAVSQISHPRSPSDSCAETLPENDSAILSDSESPPQDVASRPVASAPNTPVVKVAQRSSPRVGHVRSLTAPAVPADLSLTVSDDSDEDSRLKPQMVRKKSGELVRPALRVSHRRPSSMPGTPILSKAVHFDSHLEHVRHFLQVDRPLAVSAGSSPVETYQGETEFPFLGGGRANVPPISLTPPHEWELVLNGFPLDNQARRLMPVRVERVWLSNDQKSLHGSVAVANLAFYKQVICRFTLDYWKTVSEINACYTTEICPRQGPVGYDRFTFTIKLSDMANLESKTLFFCIRYIVDGSQFWDNNNCANFQVDFKKKHLVQNGKKHFQAACNRPRVALPRSNRNQSPAATPRPASVPMSLDTFGGDNKSRFKLSSKVDECFYESGPGLRLKNESSRNLASDNLARDLCAPSGAAFSNRYDFGASLSAAMQAAKDKDSDALYMKRNVRGFDKFCAASGTDSPSKPDSPSPKEPATTAGGLPSTASYEELVSKYCFFGSKAPSAAVEEKSLTKSRFDGPSCDVVTSPASRSRRPNGQATGPATRPPQPPAPIVPIYLCPTPTAAREATKNSESTTSSFLNAASVSLSRPNTSSTTPRAGTPSSDSSFSSAPDRFPWTSETQAATAIRG
ncbi:hypothetical protein CDD82_5856 [Ophiocordyceps australis]|uniref:CBM21 domain-containing protein n=1 Tax=Ophiocordyceps australis TaxID=1399860 RepID=A0A2C5YZ80_9HYPO|nr:hypothetical protein CDD82_5856 [Ophiocordyceps australis]